MSVSATWWYKLPQELAQINVIEPDYAAAIGKRMSLAHSDGPCKNELRHHTRDAGKLMGKVFMKHL
jgi:hypothetical protein